MLILFVFIFLFRQKFLVARNSFHRIRITEFVKSMPCLQARNKILDVCG